MLEFYVETNQQLRDLCRRLEKSDWLAVDTEFIRENTYYPEFCLLQIANESNRSAQPNTEPEATGNRFNFVPSNSEKRSQCSVLMPDW